MSEHLSIRVKHETHDTPRIFVRKLIAFLPKEGFLAFEGYGWIPKEQLPFTVEVWRCKEDGTRNGHVFHIRVTDAYKKDVLEPEEARAGRVPCGCDDPIECGCGIQFFSCDLILYRFEGVQLDDDAKLANVEDTLPYCIDDRFSSVTEMIDAYVGLLDLPADPWKPYDSRMEDMPFYTGYYHVKKRDKNIYAEPYDKLRGIQDAMARVLLEWKTRFRAFGSDTAAFLSFLETNLPFLESWCSQYLAEMSLEEKLRGWLTYGLRTSIPLPYFQEHWKLFFRFEGDEADVVVLDGTSYDMSYRHSRTLLSRMTEEVKSVEFAHLGLHPGIPCNRERGTFCLRCEEARTMKAAEVYRSYRQRNNVFVNWDLGTKFLDAWLLAVSRMTEEEKATIHYVWPPALVYHTEDIFFSWDGGTVCSRKSFVDGLVSQRQYAYRSFEPREPDDVPRFLHLTLSPSYSLPDSLLEQGPNRWNDVYLFLLRFLSYAPTLLALDRDYCHRFVSKVTTPLTTESDDRQLDDPIQRIHL